MPMLAPVLAALAVLGLALSGKKTTTTSTSLPPPVPEGATPVTSPGAGPVPLPDSVQTAIAKVLSSKDAVAIAKLGQTIAAQFPYAAKQLLTAAASTSMTGVTPTTLPAVTPPVPGMPITIQPVTARGPTPPAPAAPPAIVPSSSHALIKEGSTGPDVVTWQKIVGVTADGIFGKGTTAATKAWQSRNGLYADGMVGTNTWAKATSLATAAAPAAADFDAQTRSKIYQATDPVALDALGTALAGQGYTSLAQLALQRAKEIRSMLATGTAVQAVQQVLSAPAPSNRQYTVKPGDNGSLIAKLYTGNPNNWVQLLAANPSRKDAKYGMSVYPNLVLNIPASWPVLASQQAAAYVPAAAPPAPPAPPSISVAPATNALPLAAPVTHQTISRNSGGADVVAWQKLIGVTADGAFGPGTEAATKAWQSKHGLLADGIVGPHSWAIALGTSVSGAPIIGAVPQSEATSKARAVAHYLRTLRRGGEVDTVMLSNWQQSAGLHPSGKFNASSAERMAELGVSHLPIIMHWPAKNPSERLITYRKRLHELARQAEANGHHEHAKALIESAAREKGQLHQS